MMFAAAADVKAGNIVTTSDSLRLQPQHAGGQTYSTLQSAGLPDAVAVAFHTICVLRATHHPSLGHHAHPGQSVHKQPCLFSHLPCTGGNFRLHRVGYRVSPCVCICREANELNKSMTLPGFVLSQN